MSPGHDWRPEIAEIEGRFAAASNATLLAWTTAGDRVVYKPSAGERPLWDFAPDSLAIREVLTYEVSRAMGFEVVPETVCGNGPFGPGSIQRFIEHDEAFDPVPLVQDGSALLWPMAVLDVVVNNADRKLGHILRSDKRLVGIDHGLTFHAEDKLRTVLWVFAGARLPADVVPALTRLVAEVDGELGDRIERDLGPESRTALARRIEMLTATGHHPEPPEDRPALPWPLY